MVPEFKRFRSLAVAALIFAVALFATAASASSFAVPETRSAPTISGKLFVGKTLTATTGVWSNAPTKFTYEWMRCDGKGASCVRIAGAKSDSYKLTSADVNATAVVLVTASNKDGASPQVNSKPTGVVSAAAAPQNTTRPSITGKAVVGELLLANPGLYSGGIPDKYTYQWVRCDNAGTGCLDVSGQVSQTYTVRGTDEKQTLRVVVTASNDYGSDVMSSDRTVGITTLPAPVIVTTSMVASTPAVTCCAAGKLSGTVSTSQAGELVTILGRPFGGLAALPIGTTMTTAVGEWSFSVRPSIQTTYQAKTSTSTGPPITIGVHPRVGLGFQNRIFSTKVIPSSAHRNS